MHGQREDKKEGIKGAQVNVGIRGGDLGVEGKRDVFYRPFSI
jgi:hypothetical protein